MEILSIKKYIADNSNKTVNIMALHAELCALSSAATSLADDSLSKEDKTTALCLLIGWINEMKDKYNIEL